MTLGEFYNLKPGDEIKLYNEGFHDFDDLTYLIISIANGRIYFENSFSMRQEYGHVYVVSMEVKQSFHANIFQSKVIHHDT